MRDDMIFFVPLAECFDHDGDLLPLSRLQLQLALGGMREALNDGLSWGPDRLDELARHVQLIEGLMNLTQNDIARCTGRLQERAKDLKWLKGKKWLATTEEGKDLRAQIHQSQEQAAWDKKHSERALPLLRECLALLRRAEAIARG
jgi:hypothetical protein